MALSARLSWLIVSALRRHETRPEVCGLEVVDAYLESIGETESACGETYEETAERLNDAVMDAAAERLWEIKGNAS